MTWITEITAEYASDEDLSFLAEILERQGLHAKVDGSTVRCRLDYGPRSKYAAVRPAVEALHSVFDPIEFDDHYQPWPISLRLETTYQGESPA